MGYVSWYSGKGRQLPVSTHSDSKVHGANIGPIWGRQDPGGPMLAPMNLAIWAILRNDRKCKYAFIFIKINTARGIKEFIWIIPISKGPHPTSPL